MATHQDALNISRCFKNHSCGQKSQQCNYQDVEHVYLKKIWWHFHKETLLISKHNKCSEVEMETQKQHRKKPLRDKCPLTTQTHQEEPERSWNQLLECALPVTSDTTHRLHFQCLDGQYYDVGTMSVICQQYDALHFRFQVNRQLFSMYFSIPQLLS